MLDFLILASTSGFFRGLLGVVLFLISFFLVFIILIQRGKGGGIAGSLTGTAQSAFGARGGDTLMWLTLTLTVIWILLCCITIYFYSRVTSGQLIEGGGDVATGTADPSPDDGSAIDPSILESLNSTNDDLDAGTDDSTTEPEDNSELNTGADAAEPASSPEPNPPTQSDALDNKSTDDDRSPTPPTPNNDG